MTAPLGGPQGRAPDAAPRAAAPAAAAFDAIVIAGGPGAGERVLGLTLGERGRRAAERAGARRVQVVPELAGAARALAAWHAEGGGLPLAIVRAGDQVVHPPLVEALRAAAGPCRIAVDAAGAYAGALWLEAAAAAAALAALAAPAGEAPPAAPAGRASPAPAAGGPAAGGADAALARRALTEGATRVALPPVARHPAATPAERRAAARMLLQILVKPEDSPISKYIYRPVSRPLTRLLVGTPVTPNQISLAVLALGALGCWLVAQPGPRALAIGSGLVLLAGFIDGCDGELARLRLTTSKLGAWLDTIVDELTTGMYLAAIGYHAAQALPDQRWIAPSVVAGLACYAAGVYCIYFYLVVVSKTGNSQHYVGDLELIELPEGGPALRPRRRARPVPGPIARIGGALVLVVRRDFVNLAAFAGALANAYLAIYLAMLAGVVVAAAVMVPEHVRLRGQLRQLRRRGAAPRLAV